MIDFAVAAVLGAVATALLALALLPLVRRRAVRLTRRRIEAELPASAAEIRAGRDLVRAEAAVALNRAEQRIAQEGDRRAGLLADLSRAGEEIRRLDSELDDARGLADARAAEIDRLQGFEAEIENTREERDALVGESRIRERERDTAEMAAHGHRIEIAALGTRVGALEDELRDAARVNHELTEAAVDRDGQIALQRIELGRRQTALSAAEARLATQDRRLGELQAALDRAGREAEEGRSRLQADGEVIRGALRQVALDIARAAMGRRSGPA